MEKERKRKGEGRGAAVAAGRGLLPYIQSDPGLPSLIKELRRSQQKLGFKFSQYYLGVINRERRGRRGAKRAVINERGDGEMIHYWYFLCISEM